MISARVAPGIPNSIAEARAKIEASGIGLTDLTDTNPTRHRLFDPTILDIVARCVERAAVYHPTPRGPWPARAALAERFGGDPNDYWLTASTSEAYGWLFTLLCDPGDRVAVPTPGYPLIEPLARLHSVKTTPYQMMYVHPSGWEVDHDSVEESIENLSDMAAGSTKALVAVHPNNPTGEYADPWMAEACAWAGVALIADEVFFPYRLDESTPPPPRLSGNDTALTFGLDGLSKLLAAPQLKLGWIRLSGPRSLKQEAARALDEIADTYLSVNSPVYLALPQLLNLADSTAARITARLRANLASAKEVFRDLRIRTIGGGWMMLLDVPPLLSADELVIALMERAGLYVHPGYFYDLPDSTLALSLLPEQGVFRESCFRLAAGIRKY